MLYTNLYRQVKIVSFTKFLFYNLSDFENQMIVRLLDIKFVRISLKK